MKIAIATEKMAQTVLLIGEWLLKQQQQLKQQQRKLEEKQQLIEEQQQEIEQLKEALDKLKNRSSSNSSIPPLLRPTEKAQRQKQAEKREKTRTQIRPSRQDPKWIW
jgi:peptidoglycan hydrolase CwlO-like protein